MARKYNEHGIMILTDKDRERIAAISRQATADYLANRVTYPHPSELKLLTQTRIRQLGFTDHTLDARPEDLNIEDILASLSSYRGSRRNRGRNRNRGNQGRGQQPKSNRNRGGNQGGNQGGGKSLPNPQTVLSVVQTVIQQSGLKPVTASGKVVWGEQNFEFLDSTKVAWFIDSYKAYIPLAHIWLCAEVSKQGLADLGKATGYIAISSKENNRGQAVGILVHPSLTLVGAPVEDDDVGNVQGVPDLRPSLRQDIKDWNGNEFFACAVHLKSMRGGPQTTAAIRHQQCQILANHLTGSGIVGGDWNSKLRSTNDIQPLLQVGGVLAGAGDTRSTQAMGGDLDGFVQLKMPSLLGPIDLLDWLAAMGRQLTDHDALIAS